MRKKIDFFHDGKAFEAVLLGSIGFYTKVIMKRTGLTYNEVISRLRASGVRRRDYWRGETHVAQRMISLAHKYTVKEIEAHIQKYLEEHD